MMTPTFLTANNGVWMNRELYVIPSADSFTDQSNSSGDEDEDEAYDDKLLRVPSLGETALVPTLLPSSSSDVDATERRPHPMEYRTEVRSMFSAMTRSSDSDSQEGSYRTGCISVDSLDVTETRNNLTMKSPIVSQQTRAMSTPYSARADSALCATESESSGSESPSPCSASNSSGSNSNNECDSSDSQSTTYTSDASLTYDSERVQRRQQRRINLDKIPAGVLALQRRPSVLSEGERSSRSLPLTLQNVQYMWSFDQASTDADLSTLDEPFTKEAAYEAFFPVPVIPDEVPCDAQSVISSICSRSKEMSFAKASKVDVETGFAVPHATTSTSWSSSIDKTYQESLFGSSKFEILFPIFICASVISLIALLAVLLSRIV